MKKTNKLSLFVFRRDLRLEDNTALIQALNSSEAVLTCFIFDPRQVGVRNEFKSDFCIRFMCESLRELETSLKKKDGYLHILHGKAEEVIKHLLNELPIDAVYCNRDYTPFSKERDTAIEEVCLKNGRAFFSFDDALLNAPGTVLTGSGAAYQQFTAFCNRSSAIPVTEPRNLPASPVFVKKNMPGSLSASLDEYVPKLSDHSLSGGRLECKKLIKRLSELKKYEQIRDIPALDGTSHFSAHLKFGTYSVREIYSAIIEELGKGHALLRQLYWRDFFTHIAFYFSHVFGHAFHRQYDKIKWSDNKALFKRWCEGTTGFPIVDAGMRQLIETGQMHNRVRMITASFLVKDLHIDWRWGEKFFAQHLLDYDVSVNNGNWQWVASTGCDSQPYFRIFNPWLQQAKFDPDALYIKRWVPELKNISAKTIHAWERQYGAKHTGAYPAPLIEHSVESKRALEAYKRAKTK